MSPSGQSNEGVFEILVCMRRMGVRQTHMSRSQVIDNDLNPKWNEDFKILVHEPEHQVRGAQGHAPL